MKKTITIKKIINLCDNCKRELPEHMNTVDEDKIFCNFKCMLNFKSK